MPVKSGKCIKSNALVKVLDYGVAQYADIFLVGDSILILFADNIQNGVRTSESTGHEVHLGMQGFYFEQGPRDKAKPVICVPIAQFAGEVMIEGTERITLKMGG